MEEIDGYLMVLMRFSFCFFLFLLFYLFITSYVFGLLRDGHTTDELMLCCGYGSDHGLSMSAHGVISSLEFKLMKFVP